MPIDPVKIPQNVYVEDRIIGPITLRQLMIVMGCAGVSYAIWAAMKSSGAVSAVQTGLAWTPTVIGTIFAFVKINGISLFKIILLTLERLDKPARRMWMPRQGIYVNIVTRPQGKKKTTTHAQEKKEDGHIEELSRVLDQGPSEEEEDTRAPVHSKPVKRERIQADKRRKPVDDIAPPQKEKGNTGGGGLLRDISPPPSHA